MSATDVQVLRSSGATPLAKLIRMLQSMLRRYPRARLMTTRDGFGVALDEQTSMTLSFSGHWTEADMRDCLALFATWCVADGARLLSGGQGLAGVLQTVGQESAQSNTQRG